MNEWINVKDRLPEEDGAYLVVQNLFKHYYYHDILYFAKSLYDVDKYDFQDEKGSGFYDSSHEWGYFKCDNVTHWMPLPELPAPE